MYVRMCEHCEVCACDLVSYVIIQAYVYLADEIILLNTQKVNVRMRSPTHV